MASKALILVGGGTRGTRFRPLSLDIPKVLFPVAGKPLLSHSVDAVAKVPTVKEIILIGFYEDAVFDEFIRDTARQHPHLSVKYLREYKAMGTAGGLYHFRDVILKGNPSKFFVIHADVCSSFPLAEMNRMFDEKKAKAVILGTRVPKKIAANFGAIVADANGKVVHYVEKPESAISPLVNAGVYIFGQTLFDEIASAKDRRLEFLRDSFAEEVDEDILRLEQDVLVDLTETQDFYVYETRDFWRQVKEAGSALLANSMYLNQQFQADPKSPGMAAPSAAIVPPVYIDPSAEVDPTAKLGPFVAVGPRAKVGKGARIKDSIVLEGAEVKHDATVLHSILSEGVKVGAWARVEGSPIDSNDYSASSTKTVTILAKNVIVADEVHVKNTIVLPHKELKDDVEHEVIM
ncbi:mannose-1-phosphate guanyltransferase [Trichomonascus vanleenenianus]|uniref:mannose-1-phosphate guanylyltransferase n=1 Tax=Trichomonascus vanleenenianus TaxID=2268995 RepID=UPI003ECA7ACF